MRGWISAGIWCPCGPKLAKSKSTCGDCSLVTTARTPSFSKKKRCPRPRPMWQPRSLENSFDNKSSALPGTTYTRNSTLTPAIPTGSVARVSHRWQNGRSWPSQGGSAVCSDSIFMRASVPTSEEHLVQSRNESIPCQSPPGQCNLTCCGLLRSRQRMMSSPLHHLWALVFLCSGIHVPSVPSRDRGGNVYVRSALWY